MSQIYKLDHLLSSIDNEKNCLGAIVAFDWHAQTTPNRSSEKPDPDVWKQKRIQCSKTEERGRQIQEADRFTITQSVVYWRLVEHSVPWEATRQAYGHIPKQEVKLMGWPRQKEMMNNQSVPGLPLKSLIFTTSVKNSLDSFFFGGTLMGCGVAVKRWSSIPPSHLLTVRDALKWMCTNLNFVWET